MERVESSVFDGKKLANKAKTNKEIAAELYDRADRRIGKNTTVMVDGFAISKESMNCGDWEAVPTFAGKDPRLAEPKREKRAAIDHQGHCQVCFNGGEIHMCQSCPRSYHIECLDRDFQIKAKGWAFNCPQHECVDCLQKTTDAGGMLYRCRWCERAYCEDCINFDKTVMLGNNLPEYENVGYAEQAQAFYVQCPSCTDHFEESPKDKQVCDNFAQEAQAEHDIRFGGGEEMSRAGSLTDATTIETTGVNTPIVIDDDDEVQILSSKKRKLALTFGSPTKREKLTVEA